ncbi:MAG TPA: aminotransferase class V-fold PLP-dependent enzyme [Terriglobia bacterium]|nr:aminotransferase class V-fold PLP-dependent enzyme [Terriglobia bacterium]
MTDRLSTLPEKAAMNLGAKTSIYGETSGPYADRRHFLAKMVAASGASLAWPLNSSADTPLPPGSPAGPEDESYWSKVRAQFAFEPNLIYLNNASLGVPPRSVTQVVAEGYRRLAANPAAAKLELADYLAGTLRPAVARLLGADVDEVALTRGASESLYWIANGFDLAPRDEVLMTSQEHPAGLTPWQIRAERTGVVVRQVPIPSPIVDEHEVVKLMERAFTNRTKVLLFCHVTRGGLRYPVKALCELARQRGILSAVDGAQAVGVIPVDVHALGCDLYANSLHKWSLAPAGNGVLYMRKEIQGRFRSLFSSTGTDATRYEPIGTSPLPLRLAAGSALKFIAQIGVSNIEVRARMLSDTLANKLAGIPRLKVISPSSREVRSPAITLFEIEGLNAVEAQALIQKKYRITVDEHTRDGHNALRVSTHFYNTRREVDQLITALHEMVGSGYNKRRATG